MHSRRCYIAATVDFVTSHYKVIVGSDVGIEHVAVVVVVEVFALVHAATFVVVAVVHVVDVVEHC